ncbi:MAG: HIT domain-containing protein [Candidatus Buchananbacteria bacterium]|nr:HIT domain-containing protein [Candidatus Buchananbacteria bacterium]
MPNDDLFCKIAAGEESAHKVYESENVIAFLDINPVNPGHILITPKKHYNDLLAADDEILQEMILVTRKVAAGIILAFDEYDAFNLKLNNGRIAGQVIPHLHWHIIPRKSGDGLTQWPGKQYGEGEAEEVAEKIKNQLA